MMKDWPNVRDRIIRHLDLIDGWEIVEGDYSDAPDIAATWFVDPPYQPLGTMASGGYRYGADLDYEALSEWCRSRRGQVIVCEQAPASWLPFRPLAVQRNGAASSRGDNRLEVVWHRAPANMTHRARLLS